MRLTPLVCCASIMMASNPAFAISTYKDWNGSDATQQMGCEGSPTYGQVLTVPKGKHYLDKFTFSLSPFHGNPTGNSMTVRAEVYAWDGEKASGNGLYESEPTVISYQWHGEQQGYEFHKVTFKPAALHLKPGGEYVFFVTVSKDIEICDGPYNTFWGWINPQNPYTGGTFVYFNDSRWTDWTVYPWSSTTNADLAFEAHFSR